MIRQLQLPEGLKFIHMHFPDHMSLYSGDCACTSNTINTLDSHNLYTTENCSNHYCDVMVSQYIVPL